MDLEALLAGGDRQPLIAELPDDVKRFSRRLVERESELVRGDLALDLGTHVRTGAEVAVGGHQTVKRLVRPLEVVVADEVLEAVLRVGHVREDRAAEKLVPQRLPEALYLAECLRVLGSTADVVDSEPRERLLEFGLAAPHGVLASVVGEHLVRIAVRSDAALEGLHHQHGLLVMGNRVPDHEATVVVHEHADVESLGAAQSKREDV